MATINLGKVLPYYLGEWNSTREYVKLDIVSYNGSSYICGRTNKGVTPDKQGYDWTLLASKGDKGDAQFNVIPTTTYTDYD